ncbi:hypothetical protein AAC387_Pa09g0164 [Persea americana]
MESLSQIQRHILPLSRVSISLPRYKNLAPGCFLSSSFFQNLQNPLYNIQLRENKNSNSRNNLFEQESHLLGRIELNDLDLNTDSSEPINDPISCILSSSLSLSSSIDERCRMITIEKEVKKVEEEIARTIVSGNVESLQANSGQVVVVAGHDVCVEAQESGKDERVWEWHGHIVLYEVEVEFRPEYFCGSYKERLASQE